MITLSVPGGLEYRDVAVRVVGAACKLFGPPRPERPTADAPPTPDDRSRGELADELVMQVVSAFSEAFNNLAIHGYKSVPPGRIDISIYPSTSVDPATGQPVGAVIVEITDTGHPFDPAEHLDVPDELPERGMGLFIIRSFVDDIRYRRGPPHTLTLVKRWPT